MIYEPIRLRRKNKLKQIKKHLQNTTTNEISLVHFMISIHFVCAFVLRFRFTFPGIISNSVKILHWIVYVEYINSMKIKWVLCDCER